MVHGIPSKNILLKEGDIISIDIPGRRLDVKLTDDEMNRRREAWKPRETTVSGYLARYEKMVTSGNRGAVLEIK